MSRAIPPGEAPMSRYRPTLLLLLGFVLTVGVLSIGGCGNKGPLYLPDQRADTPK